MTASFSTRKATLTKMPNVRRYHRLHCARLETPQTRPATPVRFVGTRPRRPSWQADCRVAGWSSDRTETNWSNLQEANPKVSQEVRIVFIIRLQLNKMPTCHGAVGRPGGDGRPPLVEEDVGRLLAHVVVGHRRHLAVVEAVPLAVDGVLTVGWVEEAENVAAIWWQ